MKTNDLRKRINWNTAVFMALFHLGTIAALFTFSWRAFAGAIVLAWIAGSLGLGMGYHRLLTHRGYRIPKWLEYVLTICGMLTLEGGAIQWVVTHRIHHQHTEIEGKDPHTPLEGKWWSHMGWILHGTAQRHPVPVLQQYAPDLWKDPVHRFLNRTYFVPLIILGLALLYFFGWSFMLWGTVVRVTVGLHATWLVNSATHLWGSRRFATSDNSRNNWWVALLTWGEGWHNNHHAHPRAARHGLTWYEIDMSWWGIRFLQLVRLAKSVRVPRLKKAHASELFG